MTQIRLIFVLLVAALLLEAGCKSKADEETTAGDEIGFGAVENSVYRNKYFGLSVALPPDWSVQDHEARKQMSDAGAKMLARDDKTLESAVKASELSTVSLFAAFKHPMGAPVAFNPSISGLAERVRHAPGVKSGKDYLFHTKRSLEAGRVKISFPTDMTVESFGGREFGVMHAEMNMMRMTVRQTYYATIMKGYALTFVASFTTDEDESALQEILKTITFE